MSPRKKACSHKPFVMLIEDLLESVAWQSLSPRSVWVYIELRRKYKGHNWSNIQLTYREAQRKMAPATFSKAIKELERAGVIKTIHRGGLFRNQSIYGLSDSWKYSATITRIQEHMARFNKDVQKLKLKTNSPRAQADSDYEAEIPCKEGRQLQNVKRAATNSEVALQNGRLK